MRPGDETVRLPDGRTHLPDGVSPYAIADGPEAVYHPPGDVGLGAYHAEPHEPPLHLRQALPEAAAGTPEAALTMRELDMPPGTVCRRDPRRAAEEEERGGVVLLWKDADGNERATHVTDDAYARLFREQPREER